MDNGTTTRPATQPLAGKSAVVTGGSRGIGRAIVHRLAADGATVVFSYAGNEGAAKTVVTEVEAAGGQAMAVAADMSDRAELEQLFAAADGHFVELGITGLDILVNNAGIALLKPMTEVTEAEYDRVMAVNTKGTFFALQQAIPRLRDGGRIVCLSTMITVLTRPLESVYAASKAAVDQFVRTAAEDLGKRGITVNAVSPGPIDSGAGGMLRNSTSAEERQMAAQLTPLGRVGDPEDIADVVAFLVSPDARWLTGQNIRATGGLVKV
jgi:3-oxoacyl-[acyl-carrier protein] reductase